jgi:NAD dependent epimerase/dehydratase
MDISGKKVFVTGGAGFIGSHLVEALLAKNANITCFLRYNSKNDWGFIDTFPKELKSKINVITGDLKDYHAVQKAMKDQEVIFHLGALIAIPHSYTQPHNFIQTNIVGTANILEAAVENKVERFIQTSTSEVYGTPHTLPIKEDFPLQAQSPYAASKIAADKIAESFHASYDLPVVTVRPFNNYGPRQSARAVIPTIIAQALNGNNVKLGSLYPTRDYIYATDTAQGFIQAAECDKAIGETFNLGSGVHTSIGDIAKLIKEITGKDFEITEDPSRIRPMKSEVLHLCADISKAKKAFDWNPVHDLKSGLKLTIEWMQKNLHLYKPDIYNK